MASSISESTIRDILARTRLAQVIGEHVSLKRAGNRLVGLCPFHGEKTPSFSVNDQLGFYHCFGCGESGDAISFLRSYLGVSFPEAVSQLADRAGIRLEIDEDRSGRSEDKNRERKSALFALNGAVADYYHQRLMEAHRTSSVWEYASARGIDADTARRFHLGHAPDAWGELATWLGARGLSLRDAEIVGLVARKKSGSGYYDRFRNRLMFPIADVAGRIVAFGGRTLPGGSEGGAEPAKYINSPDSPIYRKGDILYGLHEARAGIRRERRAILVEGNIDLITLHRVGLDETVAPLGTALTENQAQHLRRFTERVVLLYDGDRAGKAAARKALALALQAGLEGTVAALPDGADPDSFVTAHGPTAMRALIDKARPMLDYLLDELVSDHGYTEDGKAKILAELSPYVGMLSDFRTRDLYVARIAGALQIDERRALHLLHPRGGSTVESSRAQRTEGAAGGRSAPSGESTNTPPQLGPSSLPARERELVQWCLQRPSCLDVVEALDAADWLENSELRSVLWEAIVLFGERRHLDPQLLLDRLHGSPVRTWVAHVLSEEPGFDATQAQEHVRNALGWIDHRRQKQAILSLQRELARAERDGDHARVSALARELMMVRARRPPAPSDLADR